MKSISFFRTPYLQVVYFGSFYPCYTLDQKKVLIFLNLLFKILVTVQAHKNQLLIIKYVSHCIDMGKYQSIYSVYIVIFAPWFFLGPFYTCKCFNSVLSLPRHSFWWIFFLINTAISILFWYLSSLKSACWQRVRKRPN